MSGASSHGEHAGQTVCQRDYARRGGLIPGMPMSESQPAENGGSDDAGLDQFWLFYPNRRVGSAT
jgi:hypothetical protein